MKRKLILALMFMLTPLCALAQSSGTTPPPPPVCSVSNAGALYTNTSTTPATVYTCSYYNLQYQWVVNPSYGGLVYYPTLPSTCSGALPVFVSGYPISVLYLCQNGIPVSFNGGGAPFPPAGVPSSTGIAWNPSYQVGLSANDLVQLNSSGSLPAVSGANLTNLPPTLFLQTNGTANASQSLLNFNDTTPAAPAGYTNVLWQNSGGNESAYVPTAGTVVSFSAPSDGWPSWLVPTVKNATTTPSLVVAASAIPNSALANSSMFINGNSCTLGGSCSIPSGTVNSVALSMPSLFTVSGSPITQSGTLTVGFASGFPGNEFLATPNGATGAVGLRAIVAADIPTLNQNTTGTAANITATSNSTLTALPNLELPYAQLSGTVPTWNQSTTGNAATATALAATPPDCTAGEYVTGISANGTPACATPVGGVSSVANSDGSLTISPTSGSVVASLNTAQANTWSAPQTFEGGLSMTAFSSGGTPTSWISMPTAGPSGIGSGVPGSNPWLAYVANDSNWFTQSVKGDIVIGNGILGAAILIGATNGGSNLTASFYENNLCLGERTCSKLLSVGTSSQFSVDSSGNVVAPTLLAATDVSTPYIILSGDGNGTFPSIYFGSEAPSGFNPGTNLGVWLAAGGILTTNMSMSINGGSAISSSSNICQSNGTNCPVKVMSFVEGDDSSSSPKITTSNTVYGFWANLTGGAITVDNVSCYSNDGTATVEIGYGTGSSTNAGVIVANTSCANTGTSNSVSVSVPSGDVLNFIPLGGSSTRIMVGIAFTE